MLPKINGKSFLECTEEDLQELIGNSDYRENEYIDYKKDFPFLKMPRGKDRDEKIAEFRSDICAFANADGGYLICGISDENGCASEIVGINIPNENTDRFELERRNNLAAINPKPPYTKFKFIKLSNKNFVVIIYVKHDNYAPYIHIEDEKDYKIYKRVGNGKKTMSYSELKNMFNQSISLEKEIYNYRTERINFYKENNIFSLNPKYMLFHIIPDTFTDSSYNENMFALEKIKNIDFSSIFNPFGCSSMSIPCVDGLRFIHYRSDESAECFVHNNGVIECFCLLDNYITPINNDIDNFLIWNDIWEKISETYNKYLSVFRELHSDKKVYVCLSIMGCKGIVSSGDKIWQSKIDRDVVVCSPIPVKNINDDEEKSLFTKKLLIEFLLSIGAKKNEKLNEMIKEVYDA